MAEHASVDQQREWYESELASSIGPRFAPVGAVERRGGMIGALSTPTALLLLVLLTFFATLGTLLWRDGQLTYVIAAAQKRVIANSGYASKPAPQPWALGANNAGTASGDVPPDAPPATVEQPNEMEAALEASRAAAVPPPVEAP
jgi:hypothetical protein